MHAPSSSLNAVGVTILKASSVCHTLPFGRRALRLDESHTVGFDGLPRPDSRRLIPLSQERYPAGSVVGLWALRVVNPVATALCKELEIGTGSRS